MIVLYSTRFLHTHNIQYTQYERMMQGEKKTGDCLILCSMYYYYYYLGCKARQILSHSTEQKNECSRMSKSNNTASENARIHTSAIHNSQVPKHDGKKWETIGNKNVNGWMVVESLSSPAPSPLSPVTLSVQHCSYVILLSARLFLFLFFSSVLLEWYCANTRQCHTHSHSEPDCSQ